MTSDFLVDFPGLGILDLPVNRVAFQIASLPVYWYGLLIALAIVLCLVLSTRQAHHFNLSADDVLDTYIALIPSMIIFARLYYIVFNWQYYARDWRLVFDTRSGGLAFYGGVIGGILAVWLVTRIKKIPVARLLDFLIVYVPLGQAIGRWGNFFNQEAFGTPTSLPWGMYSNQTERYLRAIGNANPTSPVHPTFFYEFIANLIIFGVLLQVRRRRRFDYQVILTYLMLYGFVRFFVESIRTDALMIGTTLRVSMLLSAAMFLGSIALLIVLNQRAKRIELANALAETDSAASVPAAQADTKAGQPPVVHGDFVELDDSASQTGSEAQPETGDTSETRGDSETSATNEKDNPQAQPETGDGSGTEDRKPQA